MSELCEIYLKKVLQKNESINLTNITDYEEARILHVQDSLSVLPELSEAPEGVYADIGTGAGFPGVPLALFSGRVTYLIDSVGKKIRCIDEILEDLSLGDSIHTYSGRIEDFSKQYPDLCAVVTARALAPLSVLMELSSPLLKPNGVLIAFKGDLQESEYQHACTLQETLGMKIENCRFEELEGRKRTIVLVRKCQAPQIKLPRKTGFAQKKPL